jgi:hypothetical protein
MISSTSLLLFIWISYSYPNKESGAIILLFTSLHKFLIMLSLNQVNSFDIQYTNRPSLATTSLTVHLMIGQNSNRKKNYVRPMKYLNILHVTVLQGHTTHP